MIGKLDDYLRFNEMALSLRSQRQELLASNIANADTPNYKARDVDFSSALQGALARASQPSGQLATTAAGHIEYVKQRHDYWPPPWTAVSMLRICWLIIVMPAS